MKVSRGVQIVLGLVLYPLVGILMLWPWSLRWILASVLGSLTFFFSLEWFAQQNGAELLSVGLDRTLLAYLGGLAVASAVVVLSRSVR